MRIVGFIICVIFLVIGYKVIERIESKKEIHQALVFLEKGNRSELVAIVKDNLRLLSQEDSNHISLFEWICRYGDTELVKLFIDRCKGQHKIVNKSLIEASRFGHKEIVNILLDNGGNVNTRGEFGRTPLHEAVYNGRIDIVKLLLSKGANIEAKDAFGESPIFGAVKRRNKKELELLLHKGARVNVISESKLIKQRWTPLHWAIYYRDKEIIKILIRAGASLDICNEQGKSPRELLREYFLRKN